MFANECFRYRYRKLVCCVQFEAALAVDAATTLRVALSNMASRHPDVFRHVTRNGYRYSNGSRPIDCDADPVTPWRYGHDVTKAIRQVNIRKSRRKPRNLPPGTSAPSDNSPHLPKIHKKKFVFHKSDNKRRTNAQKKKHFIHALRERMVSRVLAFRFLMLKY